MNPLFGRIADRCRALLGEVASSGLTPAPTPEAQEEATLGCAMLMLMIVSRDRNKSADPVQAVAAAVVQLSREQQMTLEDTIAAMSERLAAIWTANEAGRDRPS